MHEIDKKMSKIKEFLALKNAQKAENRAIIEHAFFNNEISKSDYIAEINALDLAEKTIKELGL